MRTDPSTTYRAEGDRFLRLAVDEYDEQGNHERGAQAAQLAMAHYAAAAAHHTHDYVALHDDVQASAAEVDLSHLVPASGETDEEGRD